MDLGAEIRLREFLKDLKWLVVRNAENTACANISRCGIAADAA